MRNEGNIKSILRKTEYSMALSYAKKKNTINT